MNSVVDNDCRKIGRAWGNVVHSTGYRGSVCKSTVVSRSLYTDDETMIGAQ